MKDKKTVSAKINSKLFVVAIFLFCFVTQRTLAQDIHFSQFDFSPLTLNPATAGAQHAMQAIFNYKDQWQSVATPYKTIAFSYDMRFRTKKTSKKGFAAAGINFFSDKAGDAKIGTSQGNLTGAYHVVLNSYNTVGAGFQVGFAQHSMNAGALQWGNQYDVSAFNPGLFSGETSNMSNSFSYADLSGGIFWNFDNAMGSDPVINNHAFKGNFGLAFFHVNQPGYSYYASSDSKLYMKTVVHGGMLYGIPNSCFSLVPSFVYTRQGPSQEIFAGALFRYATLRDDARYTGFKSGAAISAGIFVRAKDAVTATVLLEYSSYSFGVSYDINTSGLQTASAKKGGLELSLRFAFPNPFNPKMSRSIFY